MPEGRGGRRGERRGFFLWVFPFCAFRGDANSFMNPQESGTPAVDGAGLRSYLSTHVAEYMVPARFVQMASLPLTPSGKIDRRHLPDPDVCTRIFSLSVPLSHFSCEFIRFSSVCLCGVSQHARPAHG